jgi:hypothetical protein
LYCNISCSAQHSIILNFSSPASPISNCTHENLSKYIFLYISFVKDSEKFPECQHGFPETDNSKRMVDSEVKNLFLIIQKLHEHVEKFGFLHVSYSRRKNVTHKFPFRTIIILSSHTNIFFSNFFFPSGVALKNSALLHSAS